ncbi:MAG: ABC transporter substrate-binding protein [Deltaproteobacteria bacterium]|nr:ABC transporter substrate-binding protein [Deltaproteobacteria bacterium]
MNKQTGWSRRRGVGGLLGVLVVLSVNPVWAQTAWGARVVPWVQMFVANAAKATFTPTQAIQDLDRTLDEYRTGEHLTEVDLAFNRLLKRRVLYGIFDIRELCRISLGSHWQGRSQTEQDHLVDLMTSLMEEKAILSKEQGQKKGKGNRVYQIRYLGEKALNGGREQVLVKTRVAVPSHDVIVNLNYKLRRNKGIWKIYDVIVDDSSLVENYTYQFTNIIEKHGYPELTSRMEKKLAEIRRQAAQDDATAATP